MTPSNMQKKHGESGDLSLLPYFRENPLDNKYAAHGWG
jgi:hypothetical protein